MSFHAFLHFWLLGLSGRVHTAPPAWIYWHARFMVAGWTILLPLGVLIARFFKITPRQNWPEILDNKFWWYSHTRLQILGLAAVTVGFLFIYIGSHSAPAVTERLQQKTPILLVFHHYLGWIVLIISWLQILSGLLRGSKGGPTDANLRGDHFDMTTRRVVFEYVHKISGWLVVLLAIFATATGLVMVDAPRWMVLVIGGWWTLLVIAFIWLQKSGYCVDTYQAIWGRDLSLPGNQRKPIGWGIRRK